MAFRWRADDGPLLWVFESPNQLKKQSKKKSQIFLDRHVYSFPASGLLITFDDSLGRDLIRYSRFAKEPLH